MGARVKTGLEACGSAERASAYRLAMNSRLYKNHVLAKQNRSSRQSRWSATSNWHVHLLSLFVTCYKCFVARKVGSAVTGKVKTFTDTFLGLLSFLAKIKHPNVVTKLPS